MVTKNPASLVGCRVFCCLCGLLLVPQALAVTPTPFLTRDMNPLVLPYGQPLPTPARLLSSGEHSFTSSLNVSNTINVEQVGNEDLFIDVESYQLNLVQDWGFEHWMLRLQIPLTAHSGGFLDNWIENYHDLMHLPEGIRPEYPQDQLTIDYTHTGAGLYQLNQREYGLGDIALQGAYQHLLEKDFALSYWLGIELPSGDSDRLTGSDSIDIAFWLAVDKGFIQDRWLYANLGALYNTRGDLLKDQQKQLVMFGNLGVQFHPWQIILLKAQLDMHSAFYDSDTKFLGHVIQLSFGGSVLISKNHQLDIAVAEDIQSEASPDVNFNISWRKLF